MRRNQLRFSSLPAESLAARLASFVRFSGATTRRMKPPGSERKICSKTTLTYFLANPNLEGEIHLMGGRFVTSQIFNLECYTLDHHCISYFIAFGLIQKFYATQGPTERVGDFVIFIFEFSQILKTGSFGFIYFIFNYFCYKNMRAGIK